VDYQEKGRRFADAGKRRGRVLPLDTIGSTVPIAREGGKKSNVEKRTKGLRKRRGGLPQGKDLKDSQEGGEPRGRKTL